MTPAADLATWNSRFGPFTAIVQDDVVLASGWTDDVARLLALIAPVDRPNELRERTDLGAVSDAVRRFDQGEIAAIDGIAVHQRSGPFHAAVRQQLRILLQELFDGDALALEPAFAQLTTHPERQRGRFQVRVRAALLLRCEFAHAVPPWERLPVPVSAG